MPAGTGTGCARALTAEACGCIVRALRMIAGAGRSERTVHEGASAIVDEAVVTRRRQLVFRPVSPAEKRIVDTKQLIMVPPLTRTSPDNIYSCFRFIIRLGRKTSIFGFGDPRQLQSLP